MRTSLLTRKSKEVLALLLLTSLLTPALSFASSQCRVALTDVSPEYSGKVTPQIISDWVNAGQSTFDIARDLRSRGDTKAADEILDATYNLLKKDKVVAVEVLGGGKSETGSFKVTFASGLQGAFKPVNPERTNLVQREKAAYKLSRLLGLDMVPPTTIRKISGDSVPAELQDVKGSLQLFITTARPLVKGKDAQGRKFLLKDNIEYLVEDSLAGRRLRIFDWLINNHDRGTNAGNYMVAKSDGYIFGIDHSVTFVGMDQAARADKVPFYDKKWLKDREFYQMLKSATKEKIAEEIDMIKPIRVEEFFTRYDELMVHFKEVLGE
jgi:hypothetical protein